MAREEEQGVLCFACGKPVGDPPILNQMPDGENCLRCAERVLEALPPILPTEVEDLVEEPRPGA